MKFRYTHLHSWGLFWRECLAIRCQSYRNEIILNKYCSTYCNWFTGHIDLQSPNSSSPVFLLVCLGCPYLISLGEIGWSVKACLSKPESERSPMMPFWGCMFLLMSQKTIHSFLLIKKQFQIVISPEMKIVFLFISSSLNTSNQMHTATISIWQA